MAVMRSIMYVPGNNPKMVEKAPSIPADIITLDLEDSVPPSEKEAAASSLPKSLNTPVPAALRCTSASTTGKPK